MLGKVKSDEEARSTARPPANGDEEQAQPDIAGAILRAKSNASAGRASIPDRSPASATAKINKFDLAQALALTTSEGEAVPPSTRPPREDDAPFVAGEVEVVGEEEMVHSGVPGVDSVPPSTRKSAEVKISLAPAPQVAIEPAKRTSNLALALIAALVGLIVIGYVYVRTR
jgi:hypothetical protein